MNSKELARELAGKQEAYKTLWDGFETKKLANGDEAKDIPSDKLQELDDLRQDMNEIGANFTKAKAAEDEAERVAKELEASKEVKNRVAAGGSDDPKSKLVSAKSIGQLFIESKQFSERDASGRDGAIVTRPFVLGDFDGRGKSEHPDFNIGKALFGTKATMTTTSDGYPPETLREGAIVFDAQRPPQVADALPSRTTTQTSIAFMEETVFTSTAAATAEGSAPSEATLTYAEQTANIRKMAVFITATEENLEDVDGLAQIIDQRLMLMLRQLTDDQIVTGSGAGNNLTGFENLSGVQSQAKGTDPVFDALHKAKTKVEVTGRARPNLFLLHSNDWEGLRLTRTADGIYILGNPMDAVAPRVWGLPVIVNDVQTENTGICLDTAYETVVYRKGVEIAMTDAHASNFTSNILTIRGTARVGLESRRDAAVCLITGI